MVTVPQPRPPKPLPADATGPGLAFHRLVFARQRRGWWTPLATGALGFVFYLVASTVLGLAFGVTAFAGDPMADPFEVVERLTRIDVTDPLGLSAVLLSLAFLWPSYLLASLIVNGKKIGHIASVAGRIRWRWMLLCAGVALVVYIVVSGLSFLLPADEAAAGSPVAPDDNPAFLASLLVVLLFVPFQSAAEEFVFRGYLMQTVGRWLKHPAWAILLPVPLFVLGHVYDWTGQVSVGVFAIAAGWLTWRTGGLEAAIALHVVNNLVAFGFSVFGLSDASATETSLVSLLSSIVMIAAFVAAVEWLWRRGDGRRTLRLTPAPEPVYAPPMYAGAYPPVYGQQPYGQQPPVYGQPPMYGQQPMYGHPPVDGQPQPYGQPPVSGQPPQPAPPAEPYSGPPLQPHQAPRWGEYAPTPDQPAKPVEPTPPTDAQSSSGDGAASGSSSAD
jgi:membrane protease YdiL (CAAX protease family)